MSEGAPDTREADNALASQLPAGHKLWKPWALDLADKVVALVAERDRYRKALGIARFYVSASAEDSDQAERDLSKIDALVEDSGRG